MAWQAPCALSAAAVAAGKTPTVTGSSSPSPVALTPRADPLRLPGAPKSLLPRSCPAAAQSAHNASSGAWAPGGADGGFLAGLGARPAGRLSAAAASPQAAPSALPLPAAVNATAALAREKLYGGLKNWQGRILNRRAARTAASAGAAPRAARRLIPSLAQKPYPGPFSWAAQLHREEHLLPGSQRVLVGQAAQRAAACVARQRCPAQGFPLGPVRTCTRRPS